MHTSTCTFLRSNFFRMREEEEDVANCNRKKEGERESEKGEGREEHNHNRSRGQCLEFHFFLSWCNHLDVREHVERRGIQKGLRRVCTTSGVRSLHEREGLFHERRAKSLRVDPDYAINRISADRAEPRIKWNSYAISYIFRSDAWSSVTSITPM